MKQARLFADARPLVDRLGRDFFRKLPQSPGVYLMRHRSAEVLYVGKAKNLQKRVCSYRVANPERMPRRTLRLLGLVENIDWETCPDELTALRRESELLLSLKPRFNRAGVWRAPNRYLTWRCLPTCLELAVSEIPAMEEQSIGPMGSKVHLLRTVLARLIWFAIHPDLGMTAMPLGWMRDAIEGEASIPTRTASDTVATALAELRQGNPQVLLDWVRHQIPVSIHPFSRAAVEADLELLNDLAKGRSISAPL